jgi:hypothetical protein
MFSEKGIEGSHPKPRSNVDESWEKWRTFTVYGKHFYSVNLRTCGYDQMRFNPPCQLSLHVGGNRSTRRKHTRLSAERWLTLFTWVRIVRIEPIISEVRGANCVWQWALTLGVCRLRPEAPRDISSILRPPLHEPGRTINPGWLVNPGQPVYE